MARAKSPVTQVLIDIGLSDVEAEVYQVALALGSRPASVIAQRSGLKRGHAYNVLSSLMQKGILQEFVKGGVKHFTCSPPSSLVAILENRRREIDLQKERLERVLPELEGLRNPLAGQPKVRFFQGLDGIKEIYEDMLKVPESEIHCFIDFKTAWSAIDPRGADFATQFVKRRNEKKIMWYAITPQSEQSDQAINLRPSKYRKVKFVPKLALGSEISVYGSRLAFISTNDEFVGVVIENDNIAATIRGIFDYLWSSLSGPVLEK